MSNKKSFTIAIVIVTMFVAILVCLFLLKAWTICGILVGVLAALGIICAASWLIDWLRASDDREHEKKEEPIEVPPVVAADPVEADFQTTFDEIKQSVAGFRTTCAEIKQSVAADE